MGNIVRVKVGGDYACFTRPEFKVERVSYPCMTPSAARGVLEAIYWKPEFRWEVREIHVLKPIKQVSILRNEIDCRQSARGDPILVEDRRQQRTSLVLRDVEYVILAEPISRLHDRDNPRKHAECFTRRLDSGQCHHTPCLGTREFALWFEPARDADHPADINQHFGQMLFDIAFCEGAAQQQNLRFYRKDNHGCRREVLGYARAIFFPAHIGATYPGVLTVPSEKYNEKYGLEGGL